MPTPVRVKHLRYEVQMLGEARRKLGDHDFRDQWDVNASAFDPKLPPLAWWH